MPEAAPVMNTTLSLSLEGMFAING
jgi:hypothetical protein